MLDGGGEIPALSSSPLATTAVGGVRQTPFVGEGKLFGLHPLSIVARHDFGRVTNLGHLDQNGYLHFEINPARTLLRPHRMKRCV